METLLSVGIDVGTTTTQLVFSRLTVQNKNHAYTVPCYAIGHKEILYRSAVHFTPLRTEREIDPEGLRQIISGEYARAGVARASVQTGAVIITGETARKENAAQVLAALSGFAGDFVVATAGPALESKLAGIGSGALEASRTREEGVLNLDIGGGTTNLAFFRQGALVDTGCLNVGGRLIKFHPDESVSYLSPVLHPFFNFPAGSRPGPAGLQPVVELLVRILEEAVGLRSVEDSALLAHFITDRLPALTGAPTLSLSGGVAALLDAPPSEDFAFGDLGVLLARALASSPLCGPRRIPAAETLRATVIGAGNHTVSLSGSTVFYQNMTFPLKNRPVICLTAEEMAQTDDVITETITQRRALYAQAQEEPVLWLPGWKNPKFQELCKLADVIAATAPTGSAPLIVVLRHDMAKALGQALAMILPGRPLLCLDGLDLTDGAYLDVGAPIAAGQVLPVVIKTLIMEGAVSH